jgi:predicted RNase H-like nuclease (RuvC/YqgF family)
MSGIREFIEKSRERLRTERQPLEARRDELRRELLSVERQLAGSTKELEELDRAARALDHEAYARPARKPTIKEAVLEVLADGAAEMTSTEILERINERFFNRKMTRTSLSPQLSRLKAERKIELHGNSWRKKPQSLAGTLEDLLK